MEPKRIAYVAPPAVPISTDELERFVGIYRSHGSLDVVRIAVLNGKLVERLGDTTQGMTYRGNGEFTGDGSPGDFRLRFSHLPANGTTRLEFVSEGEVVGTSQRVDARDAWKPSPAELAGYAGTYVSEELGAVWQLIPRDGVLMLSRFGLPEGEFVPVERDLFNRDFGAWNEPLVAHFRFGRNAVGRVTGFSITAELVNELRFVRVQQREAP
jgi:hypothetical protein